MEKNTKKRISSSFRDPNGFMFTKNGVLYRQVNQSYKENYDILLDSGLYKKLTDKNLLIPHKDVIKDQNIDRSGYKIIKPEKLSFISYPYEWCFSQLKDAALTTLEIQKTSLKHNMILKDASAYNIQFYKGKPIWIDTLSFEKLKQNTPWIAYRQFCQHFVAPLLLAKYRDPELIKLLRLNIDGIPLSLTSKLLPNITYFNLGILIHVHLHAKTQNKMKKSIPTKHQAKFSYESHMGVVQSLENLIHSIDLPRRKNSTWSNYYNENNYSGSAFDQKRALVNKWVEKLKPTLVWDLGANTGEFSFISAKNSQSVISMDNDFMSIEKNYEDCKKNHIENCLPLIMDLTNPSPNIGWDLKERDSLKKRGPAELVLALALIHHLVIGNNVPLKLAAKFFSEISDNLIIEFVPKSDSQVEKLLGTRKDTFSEYNQESFKKTFEKYFIITACQDMNETKRTLYLMKKRV